MDKFDPTVQEKANGPLTEDFKKRIKEAMNKHNLTYWGLANLVGCSGSTLGNITRYDDKNVSIRMATKLSEVIENLEEDSNISTEEEEKSSPPYSIKSAVSFLNQEGFEVILIGRKDIAPP